MSRNAPSKKVIGADNQQERLGINYWITGFTDGEGCFSVAVITNKTTRLGRQIFPEFVITQGSKSLTALKRIKDFFQCGNIFLNRRYDNHNEYLYRYCVRSVIDLEEKIIPFFNKFPLRTYKKNDFRIFRSIVRMMRDKKHLTEKGHQKILRLIGAMNRKKQHS